MKTVAWLLVIAVAAGLGYWLWRVRQGLEERRQAAEARYASFVASAHAPPGAAAALVPAAVLPGPEPKLDMAALAQQKLLLDAASKAAEANEPALSIQLYARLLSRYPATPHAAQARAAVEVQKKKFSKH